MMRRIAVAWFTLLVLSPALAEDPVLSPETLTRWRHYLSPTKEEWAFREIPWRATFSGAVREARENRMPVLLWAMNGHPLGCT